MQTRIVTVLVITGTFLTAGVVRAQDIAAGQEVARVWCSGCHLVGGLPSKAGIGAAPPILLNCSNEFDNHDVDRGLPEHSA